MPNVKFFVYSLALRQDQGEPVIIAPQTNFALDYFPSWFTFSVTYGINGFVDKNQHTTRLVCSDQSGKVIASTNEVPVVFGEAVGWETPTEELGFVASISLQNVPIEKVGYCTSKVFIDDQEAGEYRIYIGKRTLGE